LRVCRLKLSIIQAFLMLPFFCFGQDVTDQKKWTLGLAIQPEVYNYTFTGDISYTTFTSKQNISWGIEWIYRVKPDWGISSGIFFSDKGYKWKYQYTLVLSDSQSYSIQKNAEVKVKYLDIPIGINKYLNVDKNIELYGSLGILTSIHRSDAEYVVHQEGSTRYITENSPKYPDNQSLLIGVFAGAGFKYGFNDYLWIGINPVIRYTLINMNSTVLASPPTSFGIISGIYYNLN